MSLSFRTSAQRCQPFKSLPKRLKHWNVCKAQIEPPQQPGPQLRLDDPVQTIVWGGQTLNKRRFVVGTMTAAAVALGGNLGGITSLLLGLDGGQLAGQLRVDILVPVRGYKRCVDFQNGYEFIYPASWLGDQTLAYRAAQRLSQGLDPPSLSSTRRRKEVVEPSAAFGPPGSTGEENVSVVVAPIAEGFTLETLGGPTEAGEKFLSTIAPPSSSLTATLIEASSRVDADGLQYYDLEYQVQGPKFFRHNLSTYTTRANRLYTFNAQVPESLWERDAASLRVAASSFHLIAANPAAVCYPSRC